MPIETKGARASSDFWAKWILNAASKRQKIAESYFYIWYNHTSVIKSFSASNHQPLNSNLCSQAEPETDAFWQRCIITNHTIGCLHMTSLLWREMQLERMKWFFSIGISSRNSKCLCFALFMDANGENTRSLYCVRKCVVHKGGKVKKLTEKRRKKWLVNLRLRSGGAESDNARVCKWLI